jgi:hypothetical protein
MSQPCIPAFWPEDQAERGILNLNVLAGDKAAVQVGSSSCETDRLDNKKCCWLAARASLAIAA